MSDGFDEIGLPPLGHNQPPLLDEATVAATNKAISDAETLVAHANKWLAERPTISDAEMAGAAQTFTDQLRALRDDLGNTLRQARRPYDDAIALIKARYLDPQEKVRIALEKMGKLNTDWLQREKLRLAEERVARERIAAQAKLDANAAIEAAVTTNTVEAELEAQRATERAIDLEIEAERAPQRPQTKGDYAAKAMSLRPNWRARVIDEAVALRGYAKHPAIRAAALAAIVKVASDHAKRVKDPAQAPPGIEFYNTEKAV